MLKIQHKKLEIQIFLNSVHHAENLNTQIVYYQMFRATLVLAKLVQAVHLVVLLLFNLMHLVAKVLNKKYSHKLMVFQVQVTQYLLPTRM
jgi:hypothetical protein